MAELDSIMHPSKTQFGKTQQNHSKPFLSFLYKLIIVSVFIALLPLLPSSETPEFANNSFFARSYELLHLLVVGIAISYGLFSRRNSDPDIEKEIPLRSDTPRSHVSKILNVSSVFNDEEVEYAEGFNFVDESKNQTWNYSQYYQEKPVVMVAEETIDGTDSSTKPVFLPAQSWKLFDSVYERNGSLTSFRSNQKDAVGMNGNVGGKEGVVLPSPIPWRSRSGKMEVKEESHLSPHPRPNTASGAELGSSRTQSSKSPPPNSLSNTAFGAELGSSRTQSFKSPPYSPPNIAFGTEMGSSRTHSFKSPSPKGLSPSPSLSLEIRGKFNEDLGRKKSLHKPTPPPPPPPPPPPHNYAHHFILNKRDARKNFKDELENLRKREKWGLGSDAFNTGKDSYLERSVRTVGSKEEQDCPPFPRNQSKKRDEFMERMIIRSDSESDDDSELSDVEESSDSPSMEAGPQENEVDKKAGEFIAKFREQIRLQRIASIKKSSGQRSTRNAK